MAGSNGLNPTFDRINAKKPVIADTGATRSITAGESGNIFLMNRAAGQVYTLPTATPGFYVDFVVTTTVTSNSYKVITAAGTELLTGSLISIDTDSSNATVGFVANGSTHVAVTMNGTTTGGVAGTKFRLTCLSSTLWSVDGVVEGTGTVATPFATS